MSRWELLEAVLLGVVQGVTEFLPISSDGHLIICRALLASAAERTYDAGGNLEMVIALHVGTLFSILWVYRRDVWELRRRPGVCAAIALATLPLVVVALVPLNAYGDTLKDLIESAEVQTPLVAGGGLLVTAVLLLVGQRWESNTETLDDVGLMGAAGVGLFQTIAIMPGISRSGSTIAGGLLLGLRRDAAATFSFLLAIPAIAGAAVLLVKDALTEAAVDESMGAATASPWVAWLVGAGVSFVVGLFALRALIRVVTRRRLHWFAWYCAVAGVATIAWQISVTR